MSTDNGGSADAGNLAAGQEQGNEQQQGPWYEAAVPAENKDLRDWLAVKQFKDPAIALDSYRNLEKTMGSARIALPKDENDKAGWDKVFNQLGRPEQAVGEKGYQIKAPEGLTLNNDLVNQFLPVFHEAGISQKGAEKIIGKYIEIEQAIAKQATDGDVAKSDAEFAEVQREWGAAFDERVELGRRAAREFGFSEEEMDKIEGAIGTKAMLTRFHDIGSKLGEAKFEGRPVNSGFSMTPAEANAKIKEKMADPEFQKRHRSSNQMVRNQAISELEPLYKLAAGEKVKQK